MPRLSKLEEVYKGSDHLKIVAEFSDKDPNALFECWTNSALISKWWGPQDVQLDPKVGGIYVLGWPKQNWFLRGNYTRFERGKALAFTWKWDHEPDETATEVSLKFEPDGREGTILTLSQGNYSASDADQRKSHLDGWMHFLTKMSMLDIS